jgi:hypothetical protein
MSAPNRSRNGHKRTSGMLGSICLACIPGGTGNAFSVWRPRCESAMRRTSNPIAEAKVLCVAKARLDRRAAIVIVISRAVASMFLAARHQAAFMYCSTAAQPCVFPKQNARPGEGMADDRHCSDALVMTPSVPLDRTPRAWHERRRRRFQLECREQSPTRSFGQLMGAPHKCNSLSP